MITNSLISPVSLLTQTSPLLNSKATPAEATESFANFLKNAIDGVAAQETNVHKVNDQFLLGQVDENTVMIASTQAELSLSLTSQVRNKVIEAYQEIMRMQM
jgi:flagellar hook-basal body complex protein FliE